MGLQDRLKDPSSFLIQEGSAKEVLSRGGNCLFLFEPQFRPFKVDWFLV